ncbi:MAG: prepilin-type N-terminal cleavage/methylation domain-containing protein [Ignavibacteriales bacterium]
MIKNNKKGFTLIELLAVIVILAIIALIATPIIIGLIDNARKEAFKDGAYGVVKAGELLYATDLLKGTIEDVTFTYTDGVESSSVSGKQLNYKGTKPKNGKVVINSEGKIAIAIHDGTYCAERAYDDTEITLTEKAIEECIIIGTYNYFVITKGVNAPKLTDGMTPVKWDGSAWINTTENDSDWYDYSTKKWANVKTADGSFWVWIPRYAYQISDLYHMYPATADIGGEIQIKFLIDTTDTTIDETTIDTNPTYSGDSQTNYISHPAFTFGTTKIPGFWVPKFEPSVSNTSDACYTSPSLANCDKTTLIPKFVPNAKSWRYQSILTAYTVSNDMDNNGNVYGVNESGVDTHVMKNTEWGAVAYLSKSQYGKQTEEVWINPNSNFITGCAGTSSSASSGTTCNTYETVNGVKASTTGNVYGIYDMSGGAGEATMGNYNNNSASSGIIDVSTIDNKYINRYNGSNYGYNTNIIGDALYETGSGCWWNDIGWTGHLPPGSWYLDSSSMPSATSPWVYRGGNYNYTTSAGIFAYTGDYGQASSSLSFRPALIVGAGL